MDLGQEKISILVKSTLNVGWKTMRRHSQRRFLPLHPASLLSLSSLDKHKIGWVDSVEQKSERERICAFHFSNQGSFDDAIGRGKRFYEVCKPRSRYPFGQARPVCGRIRLVMAVYFLVSPFRYSILIE